LKTENGGTIKSNTKNMKSLLDPFFSKKKTCAKRKMDIKRTVGKKGRESSFGKAFLPKKRF
jgi:hypothetical protein